MALFNDSDKLKDYAQIASSFNFDLLKPSVEIAERMYIREVIGDTMYSTLADKLFDSANPIFAAEQSSLLHQVRLALGPLTLVHYVDEGQVKVTEAGVQMHMREDSKPAFQWKLDRYKRAMLKKGMYWLDELIGFLEKNRDDYPDWTASDEYSLQLSNFINRAKDFNDLYHIGNNRYVFLRMRSIMNRIERKSILPLICEDLYNELKDQVKADTVSADNAKLLVYIRQAVAGLSYSIGMEELGFVVESDGVFILEVGNHEGGKSGTNAAGHPMQNILMRAQSEAEEELNSLRSFLRANLDTYPLYRDSSCYVEDSEVTYTNEVGSKHFGAFIG